MQPTKEQTEAIARFATKDSLALVAYAGTGKTTTLRLLAESTGRKGVYLAFNRSIATEAASKFPASVACSTVHAVAHDYVKSRSRIDSSRLIKNPNAHFVARALGLSGEVDVGTMSLSALSYSSLILSAIKRFTQSADESLRTSHFRAPGRFSSLSEVDLSPLAEKVLKDATTVWEWMSSAAGTTPLGHDGYLKLWALSKPVLQAEFALVDEAQDSNPVLLGVLKDQQCQTVYVGDPFQQIYEWRGAINAMESASTTHRSALTQSFRFGDRIAKVAYRIIRTIGAKEELTGSPELDSHVCATVAPRVILSRGNAGVVSNLLSNLVAGSRCFVAGGTGELRYSLDAVSKLKAGIRSDIPDFFGFANWSEVVAHGETEEGAEIRTFVKLVEAFGEDVLLKALGKSEESESSADLTLSTAHKAKGREWESVRVDTDFDKPIMKIVSIVERQARTREEQEEQARAKKAFASEARLIYVAATRATKALELPPGIKNAFRIAESSPEPYRQQRISPVERKGVDADLLARINAALA